MSAQLFGVKFKVKCINDKITTQSYIYECPNGPIKEGEIYSVIKIVEFGNYELAEKPMEEIRLYDHTVQGNSWRSSRFFRIL